MASETASPQQARAGTTPAFLEGGGEMGALMRAHDWSSSSLGPPSGWPQSLRTVVRLMLNTGHPMYIWWGPDGACLYNDAYRQSIGPERHPGSLGRPAREVWDEIWHIIGPQIEQVMSGGGPTWHVDALVPITRNGRHEDVYWTYSYSPIDDETARNGVGGVLVVCSETTEKVLAERRLEAELERQRNLFKRAPGFIAILAGPDHVFEFVNDAYVRLLGGRELVGMPLRDAVPELAGQGYLELLDDVYATGERFNAEQNPVQLVRAADGQVEEHLLDFIYEPMLDGDGNVTGIFVEGFDVTARALAEDALRERDIRLKQLNISLERQVLERSAVGGRFWQVSPDLLGVLAADGFLANGNPAWSRVLGWSEAELRERRLLPLIHPDDVATAKEALARLEAGHSVRNVESRVRHKDGSWRWFAWVAVPLGDAFYINGRDITAEKAAAEQLAQAQDALRQSQKMEAVGQLTGGLAHDFNNLLAGISGSLDLLSGQAVRGRYDNLERYVGIAHECVSRAAALTQRLLAFSRRQTLDARPTDVNRLVVGMEELVRRTIGPAISLEFVGAAELWPTLVDPSQLENALLNLCINARDAMPEGGRITIATSNVRKDATSGLDHELPPGEYVLVRVSDTGTGMSPDVVAHAFDPFYTTKPLGQGTGLGLSMIYGFVRQSGGQVRIDSKEGKGTRMSLYLPRHDGPVEEAARVPEPVQATGITDAVIVVIDDEPTVRLLLAEVLQGRGYTVLQAEDGASGLEILESSRRVDLLITDVGLPGGMNGRQVADVARQSRPDLKVLFITGYAESAVIGKTQLDAGMQIVTKPFAWPEVEHRIHEMLFPESAKALKVD